MTKVLRVAFPQFLLSLRVFYKNMVTLVDNDEMLEDAGFEDRYRTEPDFNDPDDFEDDVSDGELMPDLLRQRPRESDGMDSVVIVDGIPAASREKLDKLKTVIRRVFKKVGCF